MRKDGLPGVSGLTGFLLVALFFGVPALLYFGLSYVVPENWLNVELPCASLLLGMVIFSIAIKAIERKEKLKHALVAIGPGGERMVVVLKMRERAGQLEQALTFHREMPQVPGILREMVERHSRLSFTIPQEAFLGGKLKLEPADRFALENHIARLRKEADLLEHHVST